MQTRTVKKNSSFPAECRWRKAEELGRNTHGLWVAFWPPNESLSSQDVIETTKFLIPVVVSSTIQKKTNLQSKSQCCYPRLRDGLAQSHTQEKHGSPHLSKSMMMDTGHIKSPNIPRCRGWTTIPNVKNPSVLSEWSPALWKHWKSSEESTCHFQRVFLLQREDKIASAQRHEITLKKKSRLLVRYQKKCTQRFRVQRPRPSCRYARDSKIRYTIHTSRHLVPSTAKREIGSFGIHRILMISFALGRQEFALTTSRLCPTFIVQACVVPLKNALPGLLAREKEGGPSTFKCCQNTQCRPEDLKSA